MTKEEAFRHFLEQKRNPGDADYLKVASWKNRYKKGQITESKMYEILTDAGYHVKATQEIWTAPDEPRQFAIMYRDESGIGVKRITAKDEFEAYNAMRSSNPSAKNLMDVSDATLEAIADRINEIIQFNHEN